MWSRMTLLLLVIPAKAGIQRLYFVGKDAGFQLSLE
jgi:hypothetical protein